MTQESGAVGRGGSEEPPRRSRVDRFLGGAADPETPRVRAERPRAPGAVRRAALVVGLEAVLLLGGALVLLYLALTGTSLDQGNAVAVAVLVGVFGGATAAGALGLWRGSPWARGPVVALNLIMAALGLAALNAERPDLGLPVLALVAVELYLLATPEARLAYSQRPGE